MPRAGFPILKDIWLVHRVSIAFRPPVHSKSLSALVVTRRELGSRRDRQGWNERTEL